MRLPRAGVCLALSLLTAVPPSWAGELSLSPEQEAPTVRLELLSLPVLPEATDLPSAREPLTTLDAMAASLPASALAAPTAAAAPSASARAQAPTAIAAAGAIRSAAAAVQKDGAAAQSVELSRAWDAERLSRDSGGQTPVAAVAAAAAVGAVLAPSSAFARVPTSAPALPAAHAVPAGVSHFAAAYGHYAAGAAIVVGTWAASQGAKFVVGKLAKRANADETTRARLRVAAVIATWTVGAVIAAHAAGMPTAALLTTLGLGGAGVTMTIKDFIGNSLEGAKVLLARPFVMGDAIQLGGVQYTVTDMDFYFLHLQQQGLGSSETHLSYSEAAGGSVKVFKPYTPTHKTRIPGALVATIGRKLLQAPSVIWQATREMPRPDLKRASLWLASGVAALIGLPILKGFMLGALPARLPSLAAGLGWTATGLGAGGVAFLGVKLARVLAEILASIARRRGWNPRVERAAVVFTSALVALAVLGAVWLGAPLAQGLVAASVAANLASAVGVLDHAFAWLEAGAIIAATRSAQNWLTSLINHLSRKYAWNPQYAILVRLAAQIGSFLVGGSIALHQIGMTWGGLLATLSATTAVVGWITSDFSGNMLYGVWLLMRKPFKVGDWIRVDGFVGQVVDMTVQYVVLSQDDGSHILVPMSVMKKRFTPLRTPEAVALAKAAIADANAQAAFVADLYQKSKAK